MGRKVFVGKAERWLTADDKNVFMECSSQYSCLFTCDISAITQKKGVRLCFLCPRNWFEKSKYDSLWVES